jgi:hypothetical protein
MAGKPPNAIRPMSARMIPTEKLQKIAITIPVMAIGPPRATLAHTATSLRASERCSSGRTVTTSLLAASLLGLPGIVRVRESAEEDAAMWPVYPRFVPTKRAFAAFAEGFRAAVLAWPLLLLGFDIRITR